MAEAQNEQFKQGYLELAFIWWEKTIVIGSWLQFADWILAAYFARQ
jgi:hypothetical protein